MFLEVQTWTQSDPQKTNNFVMLFSAFSWENKLCIPILFTVILLVMNVIQFWSKVDRSAFWFCPFTATIESFTQINYVSLGVSRNSDCNVVDQLYRATI